jgi:hypothetical protein
VQKAEVAAIIQVPTDASLIDMDFAVISETSQHLSEGGSEAHSNAYTATDELGQDLSHHRSSEAAIEAEAQLDEEDGSEPSFATAGADSTTQTGQPDSVRQSTAADGSSNTRQQLVKVVAGTMKERTPSIPTLNRPRCP